MPSVSEQNVEAGADSAPIYPNQPDQALVAALNSISRYSTSHSPALAEAALRQLRVVAQDTRCSAELRKCAESLVVFWQAKLASSFTATSKRMH